MHRILALVFSATLIAAKASADWDPELEAREEAERVAAQRAEQEKQQQIHKLIDEANAKANKSVVDARRKSLGAAANGKSDTEVNRLYEAKTKRAMEDAARASQQLRDSLSQGQGAAALKQATGKSLKELDNMSNEEAEALIQNLEKKYGQ
ncbi:MAG: hypothetical protein PHT19_16010 [Methylococcus sp.]|nr:hypothetical protein [Methylococcus sp.]